MSNLCGLSQLWSSEQNIQNRALCRCSNTGWRCPLPPTPLHITDHLRFVFRIAASTNAVNMASALGRLVRLSSLRVPRLTQLTPSGVPGGTAIASRTAVCSSSGAMLPQPKKVRLVCMHFYVLKYSHKEGGAWVCMPRVFFFFLMSSSFLHQHRR